MLAAALWGLAGGVSHCIGMCGLFVLSVAKLDEPTLARRLWKQTLFHSGRLASLALLGAASGAVGSLVEFAARFARLQGALGIAFGVVLALLALGYLGVVPWLKLPEPDLFGAGGGRGRKIMARVMRGNHEWHQPLALGAFVGLLPCGLTYSILIGAASTAHWWAGAGVMIVFGLGTIPGLLSLGMAGHLLKGVLQNARFRVAMTRAGALILFGAGALLIWRGWPNVF